MAENAPSPEAKDECGGILHVRIQLPVLEEPVGVEAFGFRVDTGVPDERGKDIVDRHAPGQYTIERIVAVPHEQLASPCGQMGTARAHF